LHEIKVNNVRRSEHRNPISIKEEKAPKSTRTKGLNKGTKPNAKKGGK
jgi:hypothetical protein